MRIRQRLEQHAFDNAEDGGGGADAERECENGDGGEAWTLAEHAQAVANSLHQIFDEVHTASVAAFFFDLIEGTEFQAGAAAGFCWCETGVDQLLDVLIEMEAELGVEFIFDGVALKQRAQADPKISEHCALLCCLEHLGDGGGQLFPLIFFGF